MGLPVTTPLLRVETQQINVAACAFYSAQGGVLTRVEPFAYPELPNEIRLVWQKVILGQGVRVDGEGRAARGALPTAATTSVTA